MPFDQVLKRVSFEGGEIKTDPTFSGIELANCGGYRYFTLMQVEEIVREASKLPEEQRASIASLLLHGLEKPHHWVSDEEVTGRVREAEEDPSVMISFDEFVSGIKLGGS